MTVRCRNTPTRSSTFCRPLRQGDLLPGRTPSQRQSPRRAQGARRRPHRSHPHPEPSGRHASPAARPSKQEIEQGIASVTAALGDGTAPAPFLRIPGLRVNDGMEAFAASRGLQIWSADFPADDWRDVSANRVYDLAIQRLEAKGKGILLLHDIQPRTVEALPRILHELKARGYRIVHVVPAAADRPATPTEPAQWLLHPPSEMVAISRWPKVPKFARPVLRHFPSLRFPISIGARPILACAPRGVDAASPCPPQPCGHGKRRHRRSARWPRCRFQRRAFSISRNRRA